MGDERRDFDTPGRTNGQQDQTEPVPPQDETQPHTAAPDETQPFEAASGQAEPSQGTPGAPDQIQPIEASSGDQTQRFEGGSDETQPFEAPTPDDTQPFEATPDETRPFPPPQERDRTSVMPREGAWSGRAGVTPPATGPSLRDPAPYTQQVPRDERQRPWWTPILLGVLALGLLGVLILVAWWMGRDNTPVPVEPPTASVEVPTAQPEPATQPPTAAASPTAQIVQVPRLVGLSLDDAVAKLDQLGLSYRFEYRQAEAPENTVIESSPPEGLVVPVQTTVTLVVSTGTGRSPTPPPQQPSPTRPAASAGPN